MAENNNWHLEGSYFETCNCATACPCVWLNSPTEGDCKLLVAWHIENGHLDEEILDGLNVALACYSPADMNEGNWQAALYIDDKADDHQFAAITEIYSGQLGGHPSILMSFVGEVLGIKKVRIDFQELGDRRSLIIPEIAQVEIESIEGISGGLAKIENPPLCIAPSHPVTVARSKHYQYHDYDIDWQFTERNGYYSPFVYQP